MNIILLPGFMTDASLWDDLLPTLQAIARVKAIDLSGTTTMAEMADLVPLHRGYDSLAVGFG
ncbi:pimeloyl-ACP methyl ester carboxylesterase [Rhizobium sp. BK538]|nr:pimeloyl-ACP methyl ester carboxylesterase [Rhizobium sp. BK538]TCM61824.1 hypothetical protein EV291_1561 [Rhizobium sp. BK068]